MDLSHWGSLSKQALERTAAANRLDLKLAKQYQVQTKDMCELKAKLKKEIEGLKETYTK